MERLRGRLPGELETQAGEPVLDVGRQADLVMPSGADRSFGRWHDFCQREMWSGRLGVFGFPATADTGGMTMEGRQPLSRRRPGAKATAADGQVKQGAVEGANQDAVHGTMQLVLVQRQAEMMQKALSVFDTSFDKTAAEELGRV